MPAIASQRQSRMRAIAEHRCRHGKRVERQRQRVGRGGGDEERRRIAAHRAERGERRPVDHRKEKRDEPGEREQHEGRAGVDEAIERVGGVDRREGGDAAGGGEDRRHVGLREDRQLAAPGRGGEATRRRRRGRRKEAGRARCARRARAGPARSCSGRGRPRRAPAPARRPARSSARRSWFPAIRADGPRPRAGAGSGSAPAAAMALRRWPLGHRWYGGRLHRLDGLGRPARFRRLGRRDFRPRGLCGAPRRWRFAAGKPRLERRDTLGQHARPAVGVRGRDERDDRPDQHPQHGGDADEDQTTFQETASPLPCAAETL